MEINLVSRTNDIITMAHGSGGVAMKELIDGLFIKQYVNKDIYLGDDATVLSNIKLKDNERIAISTDSYVINPLFFPGGDIGKLAVCGTVNDVSTSGAKPVALSLSFIIEEGFAISDLTKICKSIAKTAEEAGVSIVTGDTKVVDKGKCDGLFINTTGIGIVSKDNALSGRNIKDGDAIIISGSIGDHGIAIMSTREGLNFSSNIKSDCAPLNSLIQSVRKVAPDIRCFRDPTRGGLASTLNELAMQSNVDITISEEDVPIKKAVNSACEMLGYDVFQVANEGKMVAVVPKSQAEKAVSSMRKNKYGKDAAIIGFAKKSKDKSPKVFVQTKYKTSRILDMLVGEQLPRIC